VLVMLYVVPSVAKVLLAPIFSNLHDLGMERDLTIELEMNSADIRSIYRRSRMLFYRISFRFHVRFETYEREQYFCH